MKANELMIGDWVYDTLSQTDIKVNRGCFEINPLNGICYAENLIPIPLTGEILEKNGFKKCNVDDDGAVQYEFGDDNLGIDLWVSRPCLLGAWRKWKGMEKSYCMINELPIRYVHELQNAMRICGIDKEIEL